MNSDNLNPGRLISYPFILGDGVQVALYLPARITMSDAKRLANFIKALVVEGEESIEDAFKS